MSDAKAAPPTAPDRILVPVWDVPVRITHWVLVLLLAGLVVTGLVGGALLEWHMRLGQVLIAVVAFRVLWGFAGSRNARFRTFVRGPRAVARYARSYLARAPEVHASHNPAGGWMVVLLLVAMLVQAGVGLFTNDGELWAGPLAEHVTQATSDAMSWFHRRFWWVIVALAAVHVAAVFLYLVVLRDNLVMAMVRGGKRLPPDIARPEDAAATAARAVALLVAALVLVFGLLSFAY